MTTDQFEGPTDTGEFADDRYGQVISGTSTPSVAYVNESGVPDDIIMDELRNNRDIASAIEQWSQSLARTTQPSLDVFNRTKWSGAKHPFAQMSQTAWAVEHDDVLSTLADVVEGLSFHKCRFELFDTDEQDMWNQWAGDVDLDSLLRGSTRELFKVSTLYIGLWWEKKVYAVRDNMVDQVIEETMTEVKKNDKKDADEQYEEQRRFDPLLPSVGDREDPDAEPKRGGNTKRKKKFAVEVPTATTIFDPTKILPVGTLMFGRERFAYIASQGEEEAFASVMKGDVVDPTVLQLIEGKYTPSKEERHLCGDLEINPDKLWLLKRDAVFRHTLTRAQYERFAPNRLSSALPIVDMKGHLRNSDRASLIGNTNFIVVITKGTDKWPGKPAEVANLQEQARVIARLPVLVGDHRLKVEIVSPPIDNTLTDSRYQVLDSRLVFKALQTFSPVTQGGNASGAGVSEMSRVVARGLESRRHMLVRSFEKFIFNKMVERNEGVIEESPSLVFVPKRITLDFKADIIQQILKLRDRGDLSRETMLEELDFDQDIEVQRRATEKLAHDKVFNSAVPHSSPGANPLGAGPAGANVGPAGQPRTEGGRPAGKTETQPRKPKST